MIKENKKKLILTSVVTLLPILIGVLLWNKLPEQVPTHWNAAGEVDGWSSRAFAVFGLPCFLFAIHWICLLVTSADPKKQNIQGKPLNIVFWICPFISLLCAALTYGTALGAEFKVDKILPLFMGALFIVLGVYLPKCKQNYSVGIKLPWTLNDEENWNKTHKLAGKVWLVGGVAFFFLILVPASFMTIALLFIALVITTIPVVYSYLLYSQADKKEED